MVGIALTLGVMTQAQAMKNIADDTPRNFHASSSVPVDRTDKEPTMKLRDSKAASYNQSLMNVE